MKWQEDAIIVLAFWALYGPLGLITWYEAGMQHNFDLIIILMAGITLVLVYLFSRLVASLLHKNKGKKPKKEKEEESKQKPSIEPKQKQEPPLPPISYDNVFKENFGNNPEELN